MEMPEGEERRGEKTEVFEAVMTENFSKRMSDTKLFREYQAG